MGFIHVVWEQSQRKVHEKKINDRKTKFNSFIDGGKGDGESGGVEIKYCRDYVQLFFHPACMPYIIIIITCTVHRNVKCNVET